MADELAGGTKEDAIPIISDARGFLDACVINAPHDAVTAICVFNNYEADKEAN